MKIDELLKVMKKLRSPEGCPWDRAQTHQSLMPFIMDECGELLDAIAAEDDANFKEELGDVLMHIVLHSVMAEERGAFTFDDVVEGITAKMISRHPHVFGREAVSSASEVVDLWEKVKAKEKNHAPRANASKLDGVANHCPALLQAEKVQKKAAKVGFDWTEQTQILDKIGEEYQELREAVQAGDDEHIDEELGDLLFAAANLSRFRKRDSAELLLARATAKFRKRFQRMEKMLSDNGKKIEDCSPEEMDALWNRAKAEEKA
ncbi:MAG: nucleoside triphosphate pyrophosphohydrolase [Lentisphaeria bacterium]|nr:nucleoside triphosphate pyrophosphohydrolase [Lentisphaeria bacterium]